MYRRHPARPAIRSPVPFSPFRGAASLRGSTARELQSPGPHSPVIRNFETHKSCRSYALRQTGVMAFSSRTVYNVSHAASASETLLTTRFPEAYIGLIRESNHCIYLENQFCERLSCRRCEITLMFLILSVSGPACDYGR